MNAKELIEAATRLRNAGRSGTARVDDMQAAGRYILSTVRPDDDEPVTREKIKSDPGWAEHSDYPWRFDHITGCVVVSEPDSRWRLVEPHRILKNMGHLRRLVAALGE